MWRGKLEGNLPSRQMKLVQAWIEIHQDELMADWILAASGQTPYRAHSEWREGYPSRIDRRRRQGQVCLVLSLP
ncbi:MAG: DUF4160 domain-containing protein [Accumulibacter sp.]|uniref:DUF4160 domain-containing protein n=1 Tax=Accumulibacter sp. TaxID=2053492 RepID=UPI001ACD336C|nr:DUF4160 domain-containing protein [Candidatus Accumulibacter necessarius]